MLHVFPDTEDDKAIIMSLTYRTASLFTESLADFLIKSIDYKKKSIFVVFKYIYVIKYI